MHLKIFQILHIFEIFVYNFFKFDKKNVDSFIDFLNAFKNFLNSFINCWITFIYISNPCTNFPHSTNFSNAFKNLSNPFTSFLNSTIFQILHIVQIFVNNFFKFVKKKFQFVCKFFKF